MDEALIKLKDIGALLLTGLISICVDFYFAFIALFAGFCINFITGMIAAAKEKEGFSMEKAKEGVKLFGFYITVIFVLYAMTFFKAELPETVIVYFTLIVSYFYLTNSFRNATIIFPKDKAIQFIYEILSTEIFFRLKEYLGLKRKSSNE
ncbi:phage holin family protein [Proteiniphilum acetatigenes]|uniref:phage holin family protein n=1 Tax=Proteiniphilum acetatigenes TaxID=294710 RepID=UPI000362635D|nr:phage holin family protein [Proteiniphilum acetatigenes]